MNIENLDHWQQYRLTRAALHLCSFTVSELQSITDAPDSMVNAFLTQLLRQGSTYLTADDLAVSSVPRPRVRYRLTEAGIQHLMERSSQVVSSLAHNEKATHEVVQQGVKLLKLILADRQAIFRVGIAKVLAVEDEMRIVAQAQTVDQMLIALAQFRAAVLIIAGGFHSDFNDVLSLAAKNNTRVVVLADIGESAHRYIAAGAHGVVYRNATSSALVDCIRKVARGETWVHDIAVPSELTDNDMVGLRVRDRLTAKELRIVALIIQGYKNKEIAMKLGITEQVVKNYLRNLYDKIGVSDRLELALFTVHHKIFKESAPAAASEAILAPASRTGLLS